MRPLFPCTQPGLALLGQLLVADHVVLEHQYGVGHLAELVAAVCARDLDPGIAAGQRVHGPGQRLHRRHQPFAVGQQESEDDHDLHQPDQQRGQEGEAVQAADLRVDLPGRGPARQGELLGEDLQRRERRTVVDLDRGIDLFRGHLVPHQLHHGLQGRGVLPDHATQVLQRLPLTLVDAELYVFVDRAIGVVDLAAGLGDADHLAAQDEVLELMNEAAIAKRAAQLAQRVGFAAGPLLEGLPSAAELVGIQEHADRHGKHEEGDNSQRDRHPGPGGLHPRVQQQVSKQTAHTAPRRATAPDIDIGHCLINGLQGLAWRRGIRPRVPDQRCTVRQSGWIHGS